MIREEAIKWLKTFKGRTGMAELSQAFDVAIQALEQHPILDKIRAEIKEVQTYKMFEGEDTVYVERKDVLAIIDKYKAERREKE